MCLNEVQNPNGSILTFVHISFSYRTTADPSKAQSIIKWKGLKSFLDALEYRCVTLTNFWNRIDHEEYSDLLYVVKQMGVMLYLKSKNSYGYEDVVNERQFESTIEFIKQLKSLKDVQMAFDRVQNFDHKFRSLSKTKKVAYMFPKFVERCRRYTRICRTAIDDDKDYFDELELDDFDVVIKQIPVIKDHFELYILCSVVNDLD